MPPPFWAFAWAGGQALARYILDHPRWIAGKDVLDLGAGSGLAGIAALKAGARSVLAADLDAMAIAAIGLNADANNVVIATTPADILDRDPPPCGVLLIGDLFYERELAARVLAFAAAAKSSGTLVLAGDPGRSYFPRHAFEPLEEYRVPVTRDLEDMDIKRTSVWRAL